MGERTWSWELATGEKVVAKADGDGTESVYLGGHLLSRCLRGKKPDGHALRMHGADEGAYRGKDVRVFFEDDDCRLVVDGETVKPGEPLLSAATTPDAASRPASDRTPALVMTLIVVVLIAVSAGLVELRARSRNGAAAVATAGAVRLPNTLQHRDRNNLMTVHYPSSFSLEELSLGSTRSRITLQSAVGYEELSLLAWTQPSATDVWELENGIHASEEKGWAPHGERFVGEERRSDGKCHGEDSALVERHLVLAKGTQVLQWSCTFVKDGHAFRFSTFTYASVPRDEVYLNGLIDAVEL